MSNIILKCFLLWLLLVSPASAGPNYQPDRKELEQVMEDLIAWLPGAWDNSPQIFAERTRAMPEEGEHEHWHRVFKRIDAPQIGDVVFYGQIQSGARNGPLMGRSQIIYKAWIDEERGAVVINGQPPADASRFENLHERPELWSEVQFLDESAINCDFLWYRDGAQIFGVLEGKEPEKQKYGWGTCNYYSDGLDAEFFADAEWVLGPEYLWLYDVNKMDGQLFIGREDKTHTRLYRSLPYGCDITDANGARSLNAHNRGFTSEVIDEAGKKLDLLLLRAEYPAADGFGLEDRLRLFLNQGAETNVITYSSEDPLAEVISLDAGGVSVSCKQQDAFPSLAEADG